MALRYLALALRYLALPLRYLALALRYLALRTSPVGRSLGGTTTSLTGAIWPGSGMRITRPGATLPEFSARSDLGEHPAREATDSAVSPARTK